MNARRIIRITIFVLIALVSESRGLVPSVTLLDGTGLERVRFLFVDEVTDTVFLTHRAGVCNMSRGLFAKEVLATVPVWVSPEPVEVFQPERPQYANRPPPTAEPALEIEAPALLRPANFRTSAYQPTGAKTVPVRGYTRKDGTYVRPYMRSAPRR